MSKFTVGALTDCLTHTAITHPGHVNAPGEVTVTAGAISAYIWLYHGFTEATVNTNPGHFSIMTKGGVAGADHTFSEVARFTADAGLPVLANLDATEAIGQTTLTTVSGEGATLTDGELVYITDVTAVTDGEWHYILDKAPSATTVLIAEELTAEKTSSDNILTLANAWMYVLPLAGVTEWVVYFSHRGAIGADCDVFGEFREVTEFA